MTAYNDDIEHARRTVVPGGTWTAFERKIIEATVAAVSDRIAARALTAARDEIQTLDVPAEFEGTESDGLNRAASILAARAADLGETP